MAGSKRRMTHRQSLQSTVFLLVLVGVLFLVSACAWALSKDWSLNGDKHDDQATWLNTAVKKSELPTVATGIERYVEEALGYGFDYPKDEVITHCKDDVCLSIERKSLLVEPVEYIDFDPNMVNESLLANDFLCTADGPNVSIDCEGKRVVNYTNARGVKGFKVLRTKVMRGGYGEGMKIDRYDDVAYVFIFPKKVAGPVRSGRKSEYVGMFLTVTQPKAENFALLEKVADSFFMYK